jgi:hypothetical protein
MSKRLVASSDFLDLLLVFLHLRACHVRYRTVLITNMQTWNNRHRRRSWSTMLPEVVIAYEIDIDLTTADGKGDSVRHNQAVGSTTSHHASLDSNQPEVLW